MNYLARSVMVLVMVLAVVVPGLSLAQSAGNTTASGVALPQGYTVMPIMDYDTLDDSIVQLNNLTIQAVSASARMIYASRADGITCTGYDSLSSGGRAIACPSIGYNVLYQISVGSDSVLLLRNRQRASFADFAPGDRINVFGFLDRDSNFMQGLIVRDLDKPSVGNQAYYVQFNNVQALSQPGSGSVPTSFEVAADGGYPCALYSGPAGYRLGTYCPYVSASYNSPSSISGGTVDGSSMMYYMPRYTVQVNASTRVLNSSRVPTSIGIVQTGDRLNIFGRYDPQTRTIEALIIRDLSRDSVIYPSQVSLRVSVVDGRIYCITTPCGQAANATVTVTDLYGREVARGITNYSGEAFFNNLSIGQNYTVRAVLSDGASASQSVSLKYGQNELSLRVLGGGQSQSLRVIYPQNGEVLTRNSVAAIKWQVPATLPGQFSAGSSYDVFVVKRTYGSDTVGNLLYTVARNVYLDFGMTQGSYQWTVGQNLEGMQMQDGGNYFVRVCATGTYNCDEGDAAFSIGNTGQQGVVVQSIDPTSGYPGTKVTLRGSGFTIAQNVVRFEMDGGNVAYLPNLTSDGNNLSFYAPSYTSYSCQYSWNGGPICAIASRQLQPGVYRVWVENANGTSNTSQFVLYSNSYWAPAQ